MGIVMRKNFKEKEIRALTVGDLIDMWGFYLCKVGLHKWQRNHGLPGFLTCKYFCFRCFAEKGKTYNYPGTDDDVETLTKEKQP